MDRSTDQVPSMAMGPAGLASTVVASGPAGVAPGALLATGVAAPGLTGALVPTGGGPEPRKKMYQMPAAPASTTSMSRPRRMVLIQGRPSPLAGGAPVGEGCGCVTVSSVGGDPVAARDW